MKSETNRQLPWPITPGGPAGPGHAESNPDPDCRSRIATFPGPGSRLHPGDGPSLRFRLCGLPDAPALARLHCQHLSARLRIPLLEAYYRACLRSPCTFCVGAVLGGELVGFAGAVSDRWDVMKSLLRADASAVLGCVLRRPSLVLEGVRRVWQWGRFAGQNRGPAELPLWELRPVVVAENCRNRGIAQALIAAAERQLAAVGAGWVSIRVAPNNLRALNAYRKSGFCQVPAPHSPAILLLKQLAAPSRALGGFGL